MRILIVSKGGDAMGVGARLASEGHTVDFYIGDKKYDRMGVDIVNRVDSWRAALRRADLVIPDMVGFGRYEDAIRATGRPYISCNKYVEACELDRQKGMELFKRAGVKTPESWEFANTSEARDLKQFGEFGLGLVIKPFGNIGEALTMVVTQPDLWEYSLGKVPKEAKLIIQRVIEGIEISTEGWFNGRDFITPFNHTFEEKRFLNGGLGCNTGCQGNVVFASESNKLTRATVERLAPLLRAVGYRGPFDVNCIVNEKGAFALEATCRMGYDAIEAFGEGLQEPLGDFLFEVALGSKKTMEITKDAMVAIRLSIPPWPVKQPRPDAFGEPVLGMDDMTHIWPSDLYVEKGKYFTAGAEGILLKATATGRSSENKGGDGATSTDLTREALRRAYRILDKVKVGSKQYRTDIGKRVNGQYAKLKEQGWL